MKVIHVLITVWFVVVILFLLKALNNDQIIESSEIRQIFYLKMMLATAPFGYVMVIAGELMSSFFDFSISIKIELFLNWLIIVAGGYIQWFVVIPFLVSRVKELFKSK